MRSEINEADEALSNRQLASTADPLRLVNNTLHVISKQLEYNLTALLEVTGFEELDTVL